MQSCARQKILYRAKQRKRGYSIPAEFGNGVDEPSLVLPAAGSKTEPVKLSAAQARYRSAEPAATSVEFSLPRSNARVRPRVSPLLLADIQLGEWRIREKSKI